MTIIIYAKIKNVYAIKQTIFVKTPPPLHWFSVDLPNKHLRFMKNRVKPVIIIKFV